MREEADCSLFQFSFSFTRRGICFNYLAQGLESASKISRIYLHHHMCVYIKLTGFGPGFLHFFKYFSSFINHIKYTVQFIIHQFTSPKRKKLNLLISYSKYGSPHVTLYWYEELKEMSPTCCLY